MYKLLAILSLATASSAATTVTPTANPAPRAPKTASAQKYCLQMDDVTGSRVRSTECRTKDDWKQQGVDVDDLLAKSGKSDPKA